MSIESEAKTAVEDVDNSAKTVASASEDAYHWTLGHFLVFSVIASFLVGFAVGHLV